MYASLPVYWWLLQALGLRRQEELHNSGIAFASLFISSSWGSKSSDVCIKLGGVWGWRELSLSFGIGLASDADLASSTGGGSALFLSHVGYSGSCVRVYIVAGKISTKKIGEKAGP